MNSKGSGCEKEEESRKYSHERNFHTDHQSNLGSFNSEVLPDFGSSAAFDTKNDEDDHEGCCGCPGL